VLLCSVPLTGCHALFNSWLDPTAVGNFVDERTTEIRTSLSIQDSPLGISGATEPIPEDTALAPEEYRFAAGDALNIRIWELLALGTETPVQVLVDELGQVRVPVLGAVKAAGLTTRELEEELIDRLAQQEIIQDAEVVVEPLVRRKATFVIFGAIAAPATYPVPSPDYRVLEALSAAGGLADTVTDIYVFRDEGASAGTSSAPSSSPVTHRLDESGADPEVPMPWASPGMIGSDPLSEIPGGVAVAAGGAYAVPALYSPPGPPDGGTASGGPASGPASSATRAAGAGAAMPPPETQPSEADRRAAQELIEAVAPGQPSTARAAGAEEKGAPPTPSTATATAPVQTQPQPPPPAPAAPQPTAPESRWVYLNDQWVEIKPPSETATRSTETEVARHGPMEREGELPRPTIDWSQAAGQEKQQRVIHLSADALRDGDPRQNIIVRYGDRIRLMAGEAGEYYMMGQINRPGAYGLSGRKITLKAAIAAAGNLGQLAWPENCTVYRRLGDREEMIQVNVDRIFAGEDPDFYIKKDDLIVFGTHPAAVFLAVVRNAFRLTYGFGFVYDRNFADVDSTRRSVMAQQSALREFQQSNRFPGLLP